MIELPELKTALRVDLVNAAQDAYILELEAGAVAFFEGATGHSFSAAAATTLYVKGTGTGRLYLTDAIATPVVLERAYPGAVATVSITDFSVRDGYLLRNGGAVWTLGYEYQVDGNTGFAPGSEPDDVRQAVRMITAHWFEFRIPVIVGTIVADVPLSVKEIIHRYRGYPVA